MLFSATLLILLITYWSVNYFLKRRHMYKHTANIDGPSSLPFLASVLFASGDVKNTVNAMIDFTKKYKSPWKIWLGGQLYIIITNPEDVEIILNKCLAKSTPYKFVEGLLGEGLFTGPIDKWKKHRKVISTTFNMSILNSYVEVFWEHSVALVEALRKNAGKGIFDVFPFLTQFSLGITCETIMGTKLKKESGYCYIKTLSSAMNVVYIRLLSFWLHPNFIWEMTSYSKQLNAMCQSLKEFVAKITSEKQSDYRKQEQTQKENCNIYQESQRRKCFLDLLIEICETTDKWTDSELMEEAQTMAAAGVESVGSVPSYTLMMIGMHPSVQDKVYEEIEEIFDGSDRPITSEDLNKMIYLEQVIKETLRLFPVANVTGRFVDKDIEIKSYTIPQGCECVVGTLYIHRSPEIWKDPLTFDPNRFSPEEVAKRHPYSYLPFSAGPRNCIGFKFAMMAMKTVIASVVRNFKISTDLKDVSEVESLPGIVFKSAVGYRVALEERISK